MAKICPLFSGSSGNSTYIGSSEGAILIDAGVSCKRLTDAIAAAGGSPEQLRAVAVTHEHIDHVAGLKVLLKKYPVPLIASEKTLNALLAADRIPAGAELIAVDEQSIAFNNLRITRFPTSHDCPGSSGYTVTLSDGRKIAVCTDLGIVTDAVRTALSGCTLILFESNHDLQMLQNGPYPASLKHRILSDMGHLSNPASAAELPRFLQNGTTRFILGHLSSHNNLPMLALSAAKASLMDIGAEAGTDYILSVAKPADNAVTLL